MQQQPQRPENGRRKRDDVQVVQGKALAQDVDPPAQAEDARREQFLRAENHEQSIVDHQRDGERNQQLQQLGRPVDAAQQQHFDQRTNDPHGDRRCDHADPIHRSAALRESLRQDVGDVGANHVKGAVRKIDDPADAENQ